MKSDGGLRILAWPLWSPSNVYTGALNEALSQQARVVDCPMHLRALRRILFERFDIFHIHWLERVFWTPSAARMIFRVLLMSFIAWFVHLRGTKIVWTVHDPQPHDMAINAPLRRGWTARLWKHYRAFMLARLGGLLFLSESHRQPLIEAFPQLARLPFAVVPHPHFRGLYPDAITRAAARARLAIDGSKPVIVHMGNLRPYKNPEALVEAFAGFEEAALLLMAGAAESDSYTEHLRALAGSDERIRFAFDFVPDEEIQLWLRAADVTILPYRRVTNSGSALLALSFDLPVVVPDEPVFRELERLVGSEWVFVYPGELTPETLGAVLRWLERDRPSAPDLSRLDQRAIAGKTLKFFEALASGKSIGAGERILAR